MTNRSYTSKAREQRNVDFSFTLDGVEFKGDGDLSVMDVSEFARLATEGVDSQSPEGVAIISTIFMTVLGKNTYQQFRRHCRDHKVDDETVLEILRDLFTDASGRPTSRPSDSSDGPPAAPATATVVSFSRGTVEQVQTSATEPQLVSYG